MRISKFALFALSTIVLSGSAFADGAAWKDGMLFTQQELASLEGHKAFKIVFGLEPGKCTDEITAVSEWLKMTKGEMVQTYPGKGDFTRVAGDEWFQPNGTRVVVCNKSNTKAILTGVQFRPE